MGRVGKREFSLREDSYIIFFFERWNFIYNRKILRIGFSLVYFSFSYWKFKGIVFGEGVGNLEGGDVFCRFSNEDKEGSKYRKFCVV